MSINRIPIDKNRDTPRLLSLYRATPSATIVLPQLLAEPAAVPG